MKTRRSNLKTFAQNLPLFSMVFILVLIVMLKYIQPSQSSIKTKDWALEMEQKYYKENERIKRACKNLNGRPKKLEPQWLRMLWTDLRYNIVGCLNAKVGSSTWRYYLYSLLPKEKRNELVKRYGSGFHGYYRPLALSSSNRNILNLSSITEPKSGLVAPEDWHEYLKTNKILSFSFVRHPFERLVSAYKDKVLSNKGEFFRGKILPSVANEWYQNNHSFPSFVEFILNGYKNHKVFNVHWNPYSGNCNYCSIQFDVIGRMETFNEDVKYIFLKNNLPINQATADKNSAKSKITISTEEYLKQLSKKQIERLYQFYRMDFELFGYNTKPYL